MRTAQREHNSIFDIKRPKVHSRAEAARGQREHREAQVYSCSPVVSPIAVSGTVSGAKFSKKQPFKGARLAGTLPKKKTKPKGPAR